MLASYKDSVSRGTAANRWTQAKCYVTFAVQYQFNPLYPSGTQLCMYIQFLKNSYPAPTTVKNYLSGARTWLAEHGGNITAFSSFEYQQMFSGISKRSSHTLKRAAPLGPEHIRIILDFADSSPLIPRSVKPCILIGYFTFLRESNLLSPTMSGWGGPHTIMAQHIVVSDVGLLITVHSTKTKADTAPVTTLIPWQLDPNFCPAALWMSYIAEVRPWPLGRAFLTDDHRPLTARHIIGLMRLALKDCKDFDPARISLHSRSNSERGTGWTVIGTIQTYGNVAIRLWSSPLS